MHVLFLMLANCVLNYLYEIDFELFAYVSGRKYLRNKKYDYTFAILDITNVYAYDYC